LRPNQGAKDAPNRAQARSYNSSDAEPVTALQGGSVPEPLMPCS